MPQIVKECAAGRLTTDDASRHLKKKIEERRRSGKRYSLYAPPPSKMPELNIKGPDRPE